MSTTKIEKLATTRRNLSEAKNWNTLPAGRKYQTDSMSISIAHCKAPMLCRAGQQCQGGQNYWETSEPFNGAILEWLVSNWAEIAPEVLQIMEEAERKALVDCQDFIDNMQKEIDSAALAKSKGSE